MTAATVASPLDARKVPHGAPCVHGFSYAGPAPAGSASTSSVACERPVLLGCSRCGLVVTVDCHSTRTVSCEPCGWAYRERVRRVARVYRSDLLMWTLTAPGRAGHKRQTVDGRWRDCDCWRGIVDDCDGAWNASLGERWSRLVNNGVLRDPERFWWLLVTVEGRNGPREGLSYFRATEAQRRGLLHLHVLVRTRPGVVVTPAMIEDLGRLAEGYGFGHVMDCQAVEGPRAAGYVAKYVSKGSNDRPAVPWVREHHTFGRLAGRATFRTWTAARSWPLTMRSLRLAQQDWRACVDALPHWSDSSLPAFVAEWVPDRQ